MRKYLYAFIAVMLGANMYLARANDFFNASGVPSTGAALVSSTIRTEFSNIGAGFDKLPTLTGNGNKVVTVNAGGTALTATTATALSGMTIGANVQAWDADLDALAALASTAGIVARTGAGAFAVRTLTGTAAEITVTNGDGSGTPTLSLPTALTFTGKTVTGGTFTGITDIAVADGGTGASTAADARTNLGAAASATTISAGGILSGGGDLSANRTISLTAAVQADQETGTSTTVTVVPGVQHFHPSSPKAWGRITTPTTVTSSYGGTASAVRDSQGSYTVTHGRTFSSSGYVVVVTPSTFSVTQSFAIISAITTTTFSVQFIPHTGGTPEDPTYFNYVIFGDL